MGRRHMDRDRRDGRGWKDARILAASGERPPGKTEVFAFALVASGLDDNVHRMSARGPRDYGLDQPQERPTGG